MKFSPVLLFIVCFQISKAQYWQQQVNYDISVKLDDVKHELHAFESFEYINNSPDALNFIYVHLWPNAYQKKRTALFRQLEKNKNKIYYKLKDNEFGLIDSLDFQSQNQKLKWAFCKGDSSDIAIVYLPNLLKTGEKITITTPFHVKIPASSISRLGHTGQQYQITQWYPKPAVYDKTGWNQMPYLNQGEFYSEFGTFDVKITLPKNYVLGATGDLVNGASELTWMEEIVEKSKDEVYRMNVLNATLKDSTKFNLKSSCEYKTLHFHQEQVHDFAWFTSKTYLVLKEEVVLPTSKNKVTAWALFSPKFYQTWKNATKYITRSVTAYSKWNGDYMYKHVTAVEGALSAGAGMEYPNITVLPGESDSSMLDLVVAHEVGHNWFYGMLGTNERKHAWMDEGINTSNEIRYMDENYKNHDILKAYGIPNFISNMAGLENTNDRKVQSLEYILQTRINKAQSCNINARNFSPFNYGAIVYAKTGLSFYHLRKYLGDELYDRCMQTYFNTWKIKHPQPEDLKIIVEQVSGKNLDWLFKDFLQTNQVLDYKIKSVKQNSNIIDITLKNKSRIQAPVHVGLLKGDSLVASQWFEGFEKGKVISINTNSLDFDKVVIDPKQEMLQPFRRNDYLKTKGIFKKLEAIKISLLPQFEDDKHTPIYLAPVVGYNNHNKWMLGAWIHNLELPKHFEYQLMPMYAFGSNTLTGQGCFFYNTLSGTRLSNIKIGAVIKSYRDLQRNYSDIDLPFEKPIQQYRDYVKFAPEIMFLIRNRNYNKAATSYFKYRSVNILKGFGSPINAFEEDIEFISVFNYNYTKELLLYQEWIDPQLELAPDFGKLSASYKIHIVYNRKKTRGFTARAFGGIMLYNNTKGPELNYNFVTCNRCLSESPGVPINNSKQFSLSGLNDYLYDNTYPVRNSLGSGFFQQNWYMEKDGAMKNVNGLRDNYDRIFSLNLKLDVPKLPIYFFHDFAIVNNRTFKESKGVNNFGVAFVLIRNIAEVYFPIYNDRVDFYKKGVYAKSIRFQLNLDMMNPVKLLKDNF
jgi:Peptidase family M1 domain